MKIHRTLLLSLGFLTGCHGEGTGGNLTGFWTVKTPDGRQVTEIKVEKKGDSYQVIGIPPMHGRCILTSAPYPAHLADKDEVADQQIQGLKGALISSGAGTILIGPKDDWTIRNRHVSSGYYIAHSGADGEVYQTDKCFDLDGKPVQQ